MNGHSIHSGPLQGTGVSIYLSMRASKRLHKMEWEVICIIRYGWGWTSVANIVWQPIEATHGSPFSPKYLLASRCFSLSKSSRPNCTRQLSHNTGGGWHNPQNPRNPRPRATGFPLGSGTDQYPRFARVIFSLLFVIFFIFLFHIVLIVFT